MTHVSLFSGIGGIDIAAEQAGFRTVAQVERDPYCLKVLEKHWPGVHRCREIRDFPDKDYGAVTLVSGGFPCQPHSLAGKRKGRTDNRFLWPEMYRIVQSLIPKWVLAENVVGILSDENGMVFEDLCADLESEDYEVQSFIIPAGATGARHRRYRVFVLAHSKCFGIQRGAEEGKEEKECSESRDEQLARFFKSCAWPSLSFAKTYGNDYGIPRGTHRNRALGNACSPQQVYPILQAIAEVEREC